MRLEISILPVIECDGTVAGIAKIEGGANACGNNDFELFDRGRFHNCSAFRITITMRALLSANVNVAANHRAADADGAAAHRAADLNVVALERAADLNVAVAPDGAADGNFGTVMIVFCDVAAALRVDDLTNRAPSTFHPSELLDLSLR